MNLRSLMLKRDRLQCDLIIDILRDLSNEDMRKEILAAAESQLKNFRNYEPALAGIGIFHQDALHLIVLNEFNSRGGPKGLTMSLIEQVLLRFRHEMLVQTGYGPERIHLNPALHMLGHGCGLKSLVYGIEYVAEHMATAVPVINVRNSDGDVECGSGVIFYAQREGRGLVLTNRHVLKDREIIEIKIESTIIEQNGNIVYCEDADLAKIPINLPSETPFVEVASGSQILDPIVSMGYPRVPTSVEQTVLCHRGEINGKIRNFKGEEFFAISCHVSPGNSGGPIFSRMGYCAGIVTESSFSAGSSQGEETGEDAVYHLAIPEDKIRDFLSR